MQNVENLVFSSVIARKTVKKGVYCRSELYKIGILYNSDVGTRSQPDGPPGESGTQGPGAGVTPPNTPKNKKGQSELTGIRTNTGKFGGTDGGGIAPHTQKNRGGCTAEFCR